MDLPRFLLCQTGDDTDERCWVLHTQAPRLLLAAEPGGHGGILLLDPGLDVSSPDVQRAATEALDWFEGE